MEAKGLDIVRIQDHDKQIPSLKDHLELTGRSMVSVNLILASAALKERMLQVVQVEAMHLIVGCLVGEELAVAELAMLAEQSRWKQS